MKQYEVTVKEVINADYVRIISKPFLMGIIEEISNWCNDSEILKRCIASAMMLNINKLSPNCDGSKSKANLEIDILSWKDDNNHLEDNDNDN